MTDDSATLYERLGGPEGVGRLIDRFYEKVVADPELAPYFAHASLDRIRAMQREFFAAALGGPEHYSGLSLSRAHSGHGITGAAFSRYVGHLLETLHEVGVKPRDVDAVVDRISTYVDEVTGQANASG